MNSVAEIIDALLDGSLARADLARAVDEVTMRDDFDAAEALSILERRALSGEIDSDLTGLISDRIQSEPTPTGSDIPAPDDHATIFQPAAAPPPDAQPVPPKPEDATRIAPEPETRGLTKGSIINGRFELEELLGSGGMGYVYKATDLRKVEAHDRNPYVAVKILKEDFGARPDALMALQREARRAQSLAHPNIVRVYDFDRDGDKIYLTMEMLEGNGLDQLVRASDFHGLPNDEGLKIVNQIGDALAFAHEQGVAHCDLKPGNIFMTNDGQVKVIDFGISRPVRKADEAEEADVTHFDPASIGAYTPAYASPELIDDNEAGTASDIYALAVIACEILGGIHPFGRIEADKARNQGLKPTMPKGISRSQAGALQDALAFDPENRTATVRAFMDGLKAAPKSTGLKKTGLSVLTLAVAVVIAGSVMFYDRIEQSFKNLTSPPKEILVTAPQAPAGRTPADQPGILSSEQIQKSLETAAATPQTARLAPPRPVVDAVLKQLNELFEGFPCAQLRPARNGASVKIAGYLHPSDLEKLRSEVLKLSAVSSVTIDTHPISDDQCELLRMIAPFVARNRLDKMGLNIATRSPTGEFKAGEKLVIRFRTPKSPSHLYIDYFSLDSQVMHMLPDPNFANIPVAPDLEQFLGDDPSAVQWTVGPPFGVELIVALAVPEPLFEKSRPEFEHRSDYLKNLKQQLRKIVRREDSLPIAADFVFLKTGRADP